LKIDINPEYFTSSKTKNNFLFLEEEEALEGYGSDLSSKRKYSPSPQR
jgi:hypothetical protein